MGNVELGGWVGGCVEINCGSLYYFVGREICWSLFFLVEPCGILITGSVKMILLNNKYVFLNTIIYIYICDNEVKIQKNTCQVLGNIIVVVTTSNIHKILLHLFLLLDKLIKMDHHLCEKNKIHLKYVVGNNHV
jgi:hypothetical protein